ncbi:MAG: type II secretion system F family protein [Actinomycetota bacterium]
MMRRALLLLIVTLAAVAGPVTVGAQSLTEMEITRVQLGGTDPSVEPGEVVLTVKAPAALVGEEIPSSSFLVTEDGTPRRVDVERLPSDGLEVVLVVDTSGSMAGAAITAAASAARTFVGELPADARVGVVGFGDVPTVLAPLGSSRETVAAAIDGLVADGSTALLDAVVLAADQLSTGSDTRRALVVLSDGADTASTATLSDVGDRLGARDVGLDVVALDEATNDTASLAALASSATSGRVVPVQGPEDLVGVYDALATALVNQYELTVRPRGTGAVELSVVLDHLGVVGRGVVDVELPTGTEGGTGAGGTDAGPADGTASPAVVTPAKDATPSGSIVDGRAIWLGAAAFFVAFAVSAYSMLTAEPTEGPRLTRPEQTDLRRRLGSATGAAISLADRLLPNDERTNQLADRLERAGWRMRPGEFVAGALATGIVTMLLTAIVAGFGAGAVVGVVAVGAWYVWLNRAVARRQAHFADQQAQLLQLLAGGLRVGRSLPQALEAVARELDAPAAPELRRVVTELRLGRDLHDALEAMAERLESDDFHWVVQAIGIHRDVGGDLAEVLDNVRRTVNERERLRSMVGSLSAEGRLTAWMLLAMPPGLAIYLQIASPGYLDPLVDGPLGITMLVVAAGLMAVGMLWIRRLVRFAY